MSAKIPDKKEKAQLLVDKYNEQLKTTSEPETTFIQNAIRYLKKYLT